MDSRRCSDLVALGLLIALVGGCLPKYDAAPERPIVRNREPTLVLAPARCPKAQLPTNLFVVVVREGGGEVLEGAAIKGVQRWNMVVPVRWGGVRVGLRVDPDDDRDMLPDLPPELEHAPMDEPALFLAFGSRSCAEGQCDWAYRRVAGKDCQLRRQLYYLPHDLPASMREGMVYRAMGHALGEVR